VRREQLSVKITEEACDRFRRLAGEHRLTLGELFEQALDAWRRSGSNLSCAPVRQVARDAPATSRDIRHLPSFPADGTHAGHLGGAV
jgi:hypothetical protein